MKKLKTTSTPKLASNLHFQTSISSKPVMANTIEPPVVARPRVVEEVK
jgi:hypothetical protein